MAKNFLSSAEDKREYQRLASIRDLSNVDLWHTRNKRAPHCTSSLSSIGTLSLVDTMNGLSGFETQDRTEVPGLCSVCDQESENRDRFGVDT